MSRASVHFVYCWKNSAELSNVVDLTKVFQPVLLDAKHDRADYHLVRNKTDMVTIHIGRHVILGQDVLLHGMNAVGIDHQLLFLFIAVKDERPAKLVDIEDTVLDAAEQAVP
jgi:hypothetical protein